MKKTITLSAALLALMLAGCGKSSPEGAVEKFYHATQAKEYSTALTYTNLTDKEKEPLLDLLESLDMNIYEYEIKATQIESDSTATVCLRLVTSNSLDADSTENELDIPCVKQGKEWKVKFI